MRIAAGLAAKRPLRYDARMNDTPDTPVPPAPERDWLVLLSQSEVVGPLTDEDLRGCLASGQIPATARLFRFRASPDAEDREAALQAESAKLGQKLLDQEAAVRRLQADLKARDLEFEGERQQMSADMSKLRADNLRKDARIETLEKSATRIEDAEKARADMERRLRDEELRTARLASEAAGAREEAEALRRQMASLQDALAAARSRLRDQTRRLGEMAQSLSALATEAAGADDVAEEVVVETTPADAAAPRKPSLRAAPRAGIQPEVVTPVVERPEKASAAGAGAGRPAADPALASLEARARQELDMLQKRGASAPSWARRKP